MFSQRSKNDWRRVVKMSATTLYLALVADVPGCLAESAGPDVIREQTPHLRAGLLKSKETFRFGMPRPGPNGSHHAASICLIAFKSDPFLSSGWVDQEAVSLFRLPAALRCDSPSGPAVAGL